jgi:hypothetical protein
MRARDNPFSTDRVLKVRYKLRGLTWDHLLDRLARLGYRAALVGPEGSGKTTLLEDLAPRLAERGLNPVPLRIEATPCSRRREEAHAVGAGPPLHGGGNELTQRLAQLTARDVILCDGAEQLSAFAWWRFSKLSRQVGGLVITAHGEGLLPTLHRCVTTPELLRELIEDLLGERGSGLPVAVSELFARHQGNLRDALRELYDLFALATTGAP